MADTTGGTRDTIRVVELFAGVGGFRLGLERASGRYDTVMADQWEPGKKRQVAAGVYAANFGMDADGEDSYRDADGRVLWSRDINELVDGMESGEGDGVPEHDLLVGGFPCFVEGTPVTTRAGGRSVKVPIETVTPGTEVLTHHARWAKVLAVFANPRGQRRLFRVSAGKHWADMTENHRLWVQPPTGSQPAWIAAADLDSSHLVYCPSSPGRGKWVPIDSVEHLPLRGPDIVWNLEVEGDNSYVAGGMAAHNCQDYSVAKPLNQSHGMQGKKGVLWWAIRDIVESRRPEAVLLENVDRLLKSPAKQRGRDFAVILATLSDLGYSVEWQVVNAADYGFPQKRRRVFIVATRDPDGRTLAETLADGVISRACPVTLVGEPRGGTLEGEPWEITERFNVNDSDALSPFANRGVMRGREWLTSRTAADYSGPRGTLGGVLVDEAAVDDRFLTDPDRWAYTKGSKDEERVHAGSGTPYRYKEGALPFPDPTDGPARTILTSEGGSSPSRTTHCVEPVPGRFRRLVPVELERLDGFPDGWTAASADGKPVSDTQRGFMLGNALVVGIVERIGRELEKVMS